MSPTNLPTRTTPARLSLGALAISGVFLLSACGVDNDAEQRVGEASGTPSTISATDGGGSVAEDEAGGSVTVDLQDVEGTSMGTIEVSEEDAGTRVSVELEGLTPGFHGFHVHGTGVCEPDSSPPDDPATTGAFLSAGGHLGADSADHGEHVGNLSSLDAGQDGTATLEFVTDRFSVADLEDEDGSAFMVHAGADNFANIPERYAPDGPDQDTLDTGDSGDRIGCGVVEPG